MYKNEAYTKRATYKYLDAVERSTEGNEWVIDTQDVVIAGKVQYASEVWKKTDPPMDSILRIQFYILENTQSFYGKGGKGRAGGIKKTYVPAVPCKNLYGAKMIRGEKEFEEKIAYELNRGWVCPGIDKFELKADPFNMVNKNGTALMMIVNSCTEAVKND